jgi:hypothetical protein
MSEQLESEMCSVRSVQGFISSMAVSQRAEIVVGGDGCVVKRTLSLESLAQRAWGSMRKKLLVLIEALGLATGIVAVNFINPDTVETMLAASQAANRLSRAPSGRSLSSFKLLATWPW